jgi:hypothetical protein
MKRWMIFPRPVAIFFEGSESIEINLRLYLLIVFREWGLENLNHVSIKGKDNINKLKRAVSYFSSQIARMNYAEFIKKNLPIGSGVTEAACKTVIKQKFCKSGMKWKDDGARAVLRLRCFVGDSFGIKLISTVSMLPKHRRPPVTPLHNGARSFNFKLV